MNEKWSILSIAKSQLELELNKAQKVVSTRSEKVGSVDMSETPMKRRAKLRMDLDISCEARDRIQRKLDFTNNWMANVKRDEA